MEAELGPFDDGSGVGTGGNSERKGTMSTSEDFIFFFTRFIFSLSLACHGGQKLFGLFGGPQATIHDPLMLVAGIFEFVGGLCVALGLKTRPIAFLLCGEMAVAYFKVNFHGSFWPIENGGELAVLYCFFFLYLSARGAGNASIDRLWGKA
jgi:putative oxidoreductase